MQESLTWLDRYVSCSSKGLRAACLTCERGSFDSTAHPEPSISLDAYILKVPRSDCNDGGIAIEIVNVSSADHCRWQSIKCFHTSCRGNSRIAQMITTLRCLGLFRFRVSNAQLLRIKRGRFVTRGTFSGEIDQVISSPTCTDHILN
jgi:hypothetical protein